MKNETKKIDIRYDLDDLMVRLADISVELVDIDEFKNAENIQYAKNILSAVSSDLKPD